MRRIKLNNKKTIIVLSMAISILLWSYVMGDINPSTMKQLIGMSVSVEGLEDENLVITSDMDPTVDVRISGRRNDIYEIRRNDMSFSVDLSGYDEGTHTVEVELETNIRGTNADIDYSPKEIEVKIERVVSKSFGIELQSTGNFPSGMDENTLQIQEREVAVKGIRSRVDSVSKVVANLNVSGIRSDQTASADLVALDRNGKEVQGVELSIKTVNVKVQRANIKKAKVAPKIVGELPEGYELVETKVSPLEVRFIEKVGTEAIEQMETAEIDISGMTESVDVQSELLIPEGIELLDDSKVNISFIIEKTLLPEEDEEEDEVEKTFEYGLSEVDMLNMPEELELLKMGETPQSITVTLIGNGEEIDTLLKGDLKLSADFTEITEAGEYTVAINVDGVPDGARVSSINPESLTFSIGLKSD